MYKKLLLYMMIFLMTLSAVFAANSLTIDYVNEAGLPVDHVEVVVFACTNDTCESLVDPSEIITFVETGADNTAVIETPAVEEETWYVAYAFAEDEPQYLPQYQTFWYDGDGFEQETENVLVKKDICRSTIDSFSVTPSGAPGMPIRVDTEVSLDAATSSAFTILDGVYPYGFAPEEPYDLWYSTETDVVLEIKDGSGDLVDHQLMTLDILADSREAIHFEWTPEFADDYVATITTTVPDAQCASTEPQAVEEEFHVFEADEVEFCNTEVDSVRIAEIAADPSLVLEVGTEYTVLVDVVSYQVEADGSLIALPTTLDFRVFNELGGLDFSILGDILSPVAVPPIYETYEYAWTPISGGDNTIEFHGEASACPYPDSFAETNRVIVYVEGDDPEFEPEITSCDATPNPVKVGDATTLDVDVSLSTFAQELLGNMRYEWDVDSDGFVDYTTKTAAHTYFSPGTEVAQVTAIHTPSGNVDTCDVAVEILPNDLPVVDCSLMPTTGEVGVPVDFEVIATDSDGVIVDFEWNFGDGTISNTLVETNTHTYGLPGIFSVEVTVTDDSGDIAVCSQDIEITEPIIPNVPPTVDCSLLPTVGEVGVPIDFEVIATDSDGTIVDFEWDFDDGTVSNTLIPENTHTYLVDGTFTVEVTATDDAGDIAVCSQDIVITEPVTPNTPPVIDCSVMPTAGFVGEEILLEVSATDADGPADILRYLWDINDDGFADFVTVIPELAHTFIGAGDFPVTVTVEDIAGETDTCSALVTIGQAPVIPVIAVANALPTSGPAPLDVAFSSAGSSGVGILTFEWNFGDGTPISIDPNPMHTFTEVGFYTVSLTVTDERGLQDTDFVIITVEEDEDARGIPNQAHKHYGIGGIGLSDDGILNAGDTLEIYVNAENIAPFEQKSVAFNAIIQELGTYSTTTEFDMEQDEIVSATMFMQIPYDTLPGMYYVRITLSDDNVKRVVYRDIIVQ